MKTQAYVIDPNRDENYIVKVYNHWPPNGVAIVPKDNGELVTDIDWLDIVDVLDDRGEPTGAKEAVINFTKKSNAELAKQAKKDAVAAAQAQKQAKLDALKALKTSDLNTLPEIRTALLDVMDYLGLK